MTFGGDAPHFSALAGSGNETSSRRADCRQKIYWFAHDRHLSEKKQTNQESITLISFWIDVW